MEDTIQGSSDVGIVPELKADTNGLVDDGAINLESPELTLSPSHRTADGIATVEDTNERHSPHLPSYQARVGSCSYVTVNLENTHIATIITEEGSRWRQVVLRDARTARVVWAYDHPERKWIPPPAFDMTGTGFVYHNGESELQVLSLSADPPRPTHRFALPFRDEQVRALGMGWFRIAVAIGVLAPLSRRIEIRSGKIEVGTGKVLPMDLIQVPRVVYDEAGAIFLVYGAKRDILFVVLSDQTGVIVVSANVHTGQQLSRVEYNYNSATDFIDGIRVYGTYGFKVINNIIRFDATEDCLVLTVPAKVGKQSWTGFWSNGSSGVGRKIVAISAFSGECETLEIFEEKHIGHDLTISPSGLFRCSWEITGSETLKRWDDGFWKEVPFSKNLWSSIDRPLSGKGRIALSSTRLTVLKEDGEIFLLTGITKEREVDAVPLSI